MKAQKSHKIHGKEEALHFAHILAVAGRKVFINRYGTTDIFYVAVGFQPKEGKPFATVNTHTEFEGK